MGKWSVELTYATGFAVSGIEAGSGGEAADKARAFVEGGAHSLPPGVSVREEGLEYDRTAYVQKEG